MSPRVVIVGLGNPLARDEGLGPRAIARLTCRTLPEGVEAIDAGTDLLAVLPDLEGADRVVLVDAVQAGGEPGSIYRWPLDDLLEKATAEGDRLSAHGLTLLETIRLLRATGRPLPPMVLVGMEPADVAFGTDLTPTAEAALDSLLEVVLAEVGTDR